MAGWMRRPKGGLRKIGIIMAKKTKKKAKAKKQAKKKPAKARKPARKPAKKAKKAPLKKKASVRARKPAPAPQKQTAVPKAPAARKKVESFVVPKLKPPPSGTLLPPIRKAPLVKIKKNRKKEKPLSKKEKSQFRQLLLNIRDKVVDDISFLSGDNLNRSQRDASGDLSGYSIHMADQGTDNFDREFALNLVSSEQDILYEIDEAIRRIDQGTYGVCELSGDPIERERLKIIPYARYSVAAQSEMERGKTRYRPFGPTLSHSG